MANTEDPTLPPAPGEAAGDTPQEPPAPQDDPAPQAPADDPRDLAAALAENARLKDENAKRRINQKELAEQLAAAKTPEEVDAALAELSAKNAGLESALMRASASEGLSEEAKAILASVPDDKVEEVASTLRSLGTSATPPPPPLDPNLSDPLKGGANPGEHRIEEKSGGDAMSSYLDSH